MTTWLPLIQLIQPTLRLEIKRNVLKTNSQNEIGLLIVLTVCSAASNILIGRNPHERVIYALDVIIYSQLLALKM